MCKSGLDIVKGVGSLLWGIVVIVLLIVIIEVDEVCIIVVVSLPLGAIVGKVALLSALKAGIVFCSAWWPLGISYISSGWISSSSSPPIIRGLGSINVHGNWLVNHPSQCIGGVVLGSLLFLSSSSLSKPLVTVPSSSLVL